MTLKEKIKELIKKGWIHTNPKPVYVFLLFLSYLLIWIVAFALYLKFDMSYLRIWIIILGILAFITLLHAIFHAYICNIDKELD